MKISNNPLVQKCHLFHHVLIPMLMACNNNISSLLLVKGASFSYGTKRRDHCFYIDEHI